MEELRREIERAARKALVEAGHSPAEISVDWYGFHNFTLAASVEFVDRPTGKPPEVHSRFLEWNYT